ncbi:MAG: hypothetical protein WD712_00385 [Candidatus Spechtbacterales bacterium]
MVNIGKIFRFLFYSYVVAFSVRQDNKRHVKNIPEIFANVTEGYEFSIPALQQEIFPEFLEKGIRSLFVRKRITAYGEDKQVRIALRYLNLLEDEKRYLREYSDFMARKLSVTKADRERAKVILEAFGLPVNEHTNPAEPEEDPLGNGFYRRWVRTWSRIKKLELAAETIISRQIEEALYEERTRSPWPGAKSIFPPVGFKFYPRPPKLLVVSPKGGVKRIADLFVSPYITSADIIKLESRVELIKDGENLYSAYISDIGGCASVYPAIITPTTAKSCFNVIVHEWTHGFVMFTPVYTAKDKTFLSAMNETVSEYMGEEISNKIWEKYYEPYLDSKYGKIPEEEKGSALDGWEKECEEIMKETYYLMQSCLDEGRFKEAEEHMREGFNLLKHKGYPVRKMNSAYFAFLGQYAAGPAFRGANGGVGNLLHLLRQNTSLRDFLYTATSCTSLQDLERAVARNR